MEETLTPRITHVKDQYPLAAYVLRIELLPSVAGSQRLWVRRGRVDPCSPRRLRADDEALDLRDGDRSGIARCCFGHALYLGDRLVRNTIEHDVESCSVFGR